MASADVPSQVAMTAARHSTVDSHAKYQELNVAMQDKQRDAFLYKEDTTEPTPPPTASSHPIPMAMPSTMAIQPTTMAVQPSFSMLPPPPMAPPTYQQYVQPTMPPQPVYPVGMPSYLPHGQPAYVPPPSYVAQPQQQFVAQPQQQFVAQPPNQYQTYATAPAPNGFYDQHGRFHYYH